MKEQLISYETAVLAKDKGFKNKTPHKLHRNYYNHLGELNGDVIDYIKALVAKEDTTNFDTIDAPTQSLLQKWLREVHKIQVYAYSYTVKGSNSGSGFADYIYVVNCLGGKVISSDARDGQYQDYESALEEGLKQALILI